ncbi:MAG TPA: SCO family protein [Pirellula sp.]|nr:SCO family protein [Pirellula sp.]
MNRNTIRILGIIAGLLAGTVLALSFRGPSRHLVDHGIGNSLSSKSNISVDADDQPILRESTPDPGRRNEIKRMVTEAKKEDAWLKEFELTERSGRTIKSEDLRGEPYVACFFFTTCPGSCTRQSNQMQLLQSKFRGKPIKFISITVDPDIDTPEVLTAYAEKYQANKDRWLFLTGPLETIIRVGAEKFFLGRVEKRGHPDQFCLVNAEGDLAGSYVWLNQEERELLVAHINELLGIN